MSFFLGFLENKTRGHYHGILSSMDSSLIVEKSASRVFILELTTFDLVCCLQHYRAGSGFNIGVRVFN